VYLLTHLALLSNSKRLPWKGLSQPGKPGQLRVSRRASAALEDTTHQAASLSTGGGQPQQHHQHGQQPQPSQTALLGCHELKEATSSGATACLPDNDVVRSPDQRGRVGVQLPASLVVSTRTAIGSGVCGTVYSGWWAAWTARWCCHCVQHCHCYQGHMWVLLQPQQHVGSKSLGLRAYCEQRMCMV